MPKINLLPNSVAELIAAGEVVERPASVMKELIENSIDAGARHITVAIERGGVLCMKITDDGCGIENSDVPIAFLRHATSKIKDVQDLDSIMTLGFRGEALAATCSVARVELYTKPHDAQFGTHYVIEGGVEVLYEEAGCPNGTTVTVRDLFYNTPARMKFLKKDVSEGNAVAAVVDRAALSHPEISFKLLRDGKQTLFTAGDGKLKSAVYSVLGREFSGEIIPAEGSENRIGVSGYICKPVCCRASRAMQFVFLNGRFVHSGTVCAAVEQAYKNSCMVGKFPGFVLSLNIPPETVDVNVHPAKTEVRFSDEKQIFETVYHTVRSALTVGDTRPVLTVKESAPQSRLAASAYRAPDLPFHPEMIQPEQPIAENPNGVREDKTLKTENIPKFLRQEFAPVSGRQIRVDIAREPEEPMSRAEIRSAQNGLPISAIKETENQPVQNKESAERKTQPINESDLPDEPEEEIRYCGEAFNTYVIAQKGDSIFLIDKHAAHERLLFEQLRQNTTAQTQGLLTPISVKLGKEEYSAVNENVELFEKAGFELEDYGNSTVLVRAVPATLTGEDVTATVTEAAASLCERGVLQLEKLDHIYHTVACKAAIKAGQHNAVTDLETLARRILGNHDILYCPHGRPVAFEIRRKDLEKQFGRIQ